ncbi:hypothetical protein V5F79_08325 [Xanthobacter flavus]|uniref:hypothetical protein n=1 Tax=Xanthobacter flavus TaxID=281 RepID=UPI003728573E
MKTKQPRPMGVGLELSCCRLGWLAINTRETALTGKPYSKIPDERKFDSLLAPLGVQLELPPLPAECAFLDVTMDIFGVVGFTVSVRREGADLLVWCGRSYRAALADLARWDIEGFPVRNLALEALEETERQERAA